MNNFWDERFSSIEYIYGKEANEFVKHQLAKLQPGKILFPAEGEGRNSVFAASRGWEVTAFDPSIEGKKKAEMLASAKNVTIDYRIAGYENASFPENYFDCLVLVFAHMPAIHRERYHKKLLSFVKPGGTIILEGFSKTQIDYNTGGPKDLSMLFSEEELKSDFNELSEVTITERKTNLDEGTFHTGLAAVIDLFGIK